MKKHPALKQAPKSLREALERIVAYAQTGDLANCQYVNKAGRRCAIGQFFTDEQLLQIAVAESPDGEALNGQTIPELVKRFGQANIEAMTGMTTEQANAIQAEADYGTVEVIKAINQILATGSGAIYGTSFRL